MRRFLALTLIAALMVITTGAIRTQAYEISEDYGGELIEGYLYEENHYQCVEAEDIDADYVGELPDEPLWEVNFYLDGRLLFGTVSEESLIDYDIELHTELICWAEDGYHAFLDRTDDFGDEQVINVYFVSEVSNE